MFYQRRTVLRLIVSALGVATAVAICQEFFSSSGISPAANLAFAIDGERNRVGDLLPADQSDRLFGLANPAPGIRVTLTPDHADGAYQLGERMVLTIEADQDCHALLVSRDSDGKTYQLWPNAKAKTAELKAGTKQTLPSPDGNSGWSIVMAKPTGVATVRLIVSRRPLEQLAGAEFHAGSTFAEVRDGARGPQAVAENGPKPIGDLPPREWAVRDLLITTAAAQASGTDPTPAPPHAAPPVDQPRVGPVRTVKPGVNAAVLRELTLLGLRGNGAKDAGATDSIGADEVRNAPPRRSSTEPKVIALLVFKEAGGEKGAKGADDGAAHPTVERIPITSGAPGAKGAPDATDWKQTAETLLRQPGVVAVDPEFACELYGDPATTGDGDTAPMPAYWGLHHWLANAFNPGEDLNWSNCPEARRLVPVPIGIVDMPVDVGDPRLRDAILTEVKANGDVEWGREFSAEEVGGFFLTLPDRSIVPGRTMRERDGTNHGMFCASLMVARATGALRDIASVAPRGRLVVAGAATQMKGAKPGEPEVCLRREDILKGIDYCARRGARVINLSLGSASTVRDLQALVDADPRFRRWERDGVILVCAAGNDGGETRSGKALDDNDVVAKFPANLPLSNVVSVMASGPDGDRASALNALTGRWEYYSNYGATTVSIAAPGSMILGAAPDRKICMMNGTSMAAPLVTAAIALKMSQCPGVDHRKVIECLIRTAAPTESLRGKNKANGVLDLEAFLDARL